jgi:hypothetical protein
MNKIVILIMFSMLVFIGIGCSLQQTTQTLTESFQPVELVAMYSDFPIKIDGKLDDLIWQETQSYTMDLSHDKQLNGQSVQEDGRIFLAYDDNYLYVAASFSDSDVVAEGKSDQQHHYRFGDVCELFLKPDNSTWYWELYVTPTDRKTAFWFPGRGRLGLPSCFKNYKCGLFVGAEVNGTINNWHDKDVGWTAEMAMPIEDLTANGDLFEPGVCWRILIGRYNYSRYLEHQELSMSPMLPKTNFHMLENYGILKLVKK